MGRTRVPRVHSLYHMYGQTHARTSTRTRTRKDTRTRTLGLLDVRYAVLSAASSFSTCYYHLHTFSIDARKNKHPKNTHTQVHAHTRLCCGKKLCVGRRVFLLSTTCTCNDTNTRVFVHTHASTSTRTQHESISIPTSS